MHLGMLLLLMSELSRTQWKIGGLQSDDGKVGLCESRMVCCARQNAMLEFSCIMPMEF